MDKVKVSTFAREMGMSNERLLEQLRAAGVEKHSPNQFVNDEDKRKLLSYLRKSHGGAAAEEPAPTKITLKRRSNRQIRQSFAHGRTRTVNVEVRKRRTFVKRRREEEGIPSQEQVTTEASRISPTPDWLWRQPEQEEEHGEESFRAQEIEAAKAEMQTYEEQGAQITEDSTPEVMAEPDLAPAVEEPRPSQEEEVPTQPIEEEPQQAEPQSQGQELTPEHSEPSGKIPEPAQPPREKKDKDKGKAQDVGPKTLEEGRWDSKKQRKKREKRARREGQVPEQEAGKEQVSERPQKPVVREVPIPETIGVEELSNRMAIKATDVIKQLMNLGVMVTKNEILDNETATLVVEELGHKPKQVSESAVEEQVITGQKLTGKTEPRPPVVTVMGHVDHGKTSLLDYIRQSKVVAHEAGGITQHIGAYRVETANGLLVFLDTPGHGAFTAMRARGAQVTDIVILVVAADDGVQPQTVEAINHAKAAGIPIVVALTKIDLPETNPEQIKHELTQYGLIPESWGGETVFVEVSAKSGLNIDLLLEMVSLQAELLELQAVAEGYARGVIIESQLDRGRGPVATVLVREGTLHRGDVLLAGSEYGRIRALVNEFGESVESAGPSTPVEVLGLSGVPEAGDEVLAVEDERKAREVADLRQQRQKEAQFAQTRRAKLEGMFEQMKQMEKAELRLLIKADVQGSAEALSDALERLSHEEAHVKVIHTQVGGITESDVNLAMASEAIIIGFNVRAEASARRLIEQSGVDVRYFNVIYEAVDAVRSALEGLLEPEISEEVTGRAEVREVFRISKVGAVAGCKVLEGWVSRNSKVRVLRDSAVVYTGNIDSLKRYKEDAKEVREGYECGIGIKGYNDFEVGDILEAFEVKKVARTLD